MEIQFYYQVENKKPSRYFSSLEDTFFCTRTNTSSVKLKNVNVNKKKCKILNSTSFLPNHFSKKKSSA